MTRFAITHISRKNRSETWLFWCKNCFGYSHTSHKSSELGFSDM